MADAYIDRGIALAQATVEQKVAVLMRDSAGAEVTGVTSPTITISKNGSALATPQDGTWAEVGNGIYTVRLDDADTDTLGWLLIEITHASTVRTHVVLPVSISPEEERAGYMRQRRIHRSIV